MVACLLEMQGKNVLVIDNAHRTAASLAAAGIMNPITGKRLNRPHLVDQLLQMAFETYPRVERFLGGPIFQRRGVLRILRFEDETKQWNVRLVGGEYAKYLGSTAVTDAEYVEKRHGGFEVAQAGLLDVPRFVRRTRDRLLLAAKSRQERPTHGINWMKSRALRLGMKSSNLCVISPGST